MPTNLTCNYLTESSILFGLQFAHEHLRVHELRTAYAFPSCLKYALMSHLHLKWGAIQ